MVRVLIVLVTWFICWTTVFGYSSVTYNVENSNEDEYSRFIEDLREILKNEGSQDNGIPVLPANLPVNDTNRFALVMLTSTNANTTIALDVIDVYVVGFKVGGKAYFFKNLSGDIYNSKLFMETEKIRLPFNNAYTDRSGKLGGEQLKQANYDLYKYKKGTNQIRTLPVVYQMISEAARFKYIQNKLVDILKEHSSMVPQGDFLSLENNWDKLSKGIQNAKNGKLNPPIPLQNENNTVYNVSTVAEVKPLMGLLKYLRQKSIDEQIMSGSYNEDLKN